MMQPLLWLCNSNDERIQDGVTNTIKVNIDGESYSNEVEYHIWNNIRGTTQREDMIGCYATCYDTKDTGQSMDMTADVDILQEGWMEIKCTTYENKWYKVCGNELKCPIGANNTNTIKGTPNNGNFNTDTANRAVIVVRLHGNYDIENVPPGNKSFKIVVGGSYTNS